MPRTMQGITDRPFANTNTEQKGFCIARLHGITSSHAHTRSARGRDFFARVKNTCMRSLQKTTHERGGGRNSEQNC